MELTISEKLAIANSLEEAIRRLEFIMCGDAFEHYPIEHPILKRVGFLTELKDKILN